MYIFKKVRLRVVSVAFDCNVMKKPKIITKRQIVTELKL